MHNRLFTQARLATSGVCEEDTCILCGSKPEMRKHMFFQCDYSQQCLREIQDMWRRYARKSRGKISRAFIWSILAATIYHIWMARNEALWQKSVHIPTKVLKLIKMDAKYRIMEILHRKHTCKDKGWIEDILQRDNV
ncbi:hypothetical protein R3W88_027310 [Solanum pinnatisectum]|uniref:Reverse transcriptase zinc-binding domain-containing protein n=1 Tax=Solanum pinnatisectum TaxID=50273 RepID=A0AAV9LFW9_9SOLN|nr:hypothetical protein R3W88_027310 [Solanum pinnatisectum]